jgi:hypothetical protein
MRCWYPTCLKLRRAWLQFYVEALVDAFHALKLAVGPGTPLLKDCMQPQRLQDIVTFLVIDHIHYWKLQNSSGLCGNRVAPRQMHVRTILSGSGMM